MLSKAYFRIVTSVEGEIPLVSPLEFQQFPLLNQQTHLRDPCIETSKGGQVGVNQKGKKGEELKGALEEALQRGA